MTYVVLSTTIDILYVVLSTVNDILLYLVLSNVIDILYVVLSIVNDIVTDRVSLVKRLSLRQGTQSTISDTLYKTVLNSKKQQKTMPRQVTMVGTK